MAYRTRCRSTQGFRWCHRHAAQRSRKAFLSTARLWHDRATSPATTCEIERNLYSRRAKRRLFAANCLSGRVATSVWICSVVAQKFDKTVLQYRCQKERNKLQFLYFLEMHYRQRDYRWGAFVARVGEGVLKRHWESREIMLENIAAQRINTV